MSAAEFKWHFHFELLLLAIFLGVVAAFAADQGIAKVAAALGVWSLYGMATGILVERHNRNE